MQYFDFEEEIKQLDGQITELNALATQKDIDYSRELAQLQTKKITKLKKIYSNLTDWQIVQVARHPERPKFKDYLENIVSEFRELHGDKYLADDPAIITGFGTIGNEKIMLVGHNKGRTLKEKQKCHFGCAHPEGYRKALQKMKLAEKFHLPVLSFVDTPGAYPGIGAEERGQAQTIAENLSAMSQLKTPIISVVIGEGGSGGALGISAGDRLAMLQYSYYSVISPEGCEAILWKTKSKDAQAEAIKQAAESLHLTTEKLSKLGLIDKIIPEPIGGAHRDPRVAYTNVQDYVLKTLDELQKIPIPDLVNQRYEKYRKIGVVKSG